MAVAITSGVLTPNVVANPSFDTYYQRVEIVNRGAYDIWYRLDGIDPEIGGDDSGIIPAMSYQDDIRNDLSSSNTNFTLISAGDSAYTVSGVFD